MENRQNLGNLGGRGASNRKLDRAEISKRNWGHGGVFLCNSQCNLLWRIRMQHHNFKDKRATPGKADLPQYSISAQVN